MPQAFPSGVLNRRVVLAKRPEPFVARLADDIFSFDSVPVPVLQEGQVLVQNHWLGLDPSTRGAMSASASYAKPTPLGEPPRAFGAGIVVQSLDPSFAVGDRVSGFFGFQEYAVLDAKVLRPVPAAAPLRASISLLGINGLTAWIGLNDICKPKTGDTVVVTAAAGAVGSVVVQLAVAAGARVIGVAGSQEKCDFLRKLGAAGTINYKTDDLDQALAGLCPDGINCVFDNVGGKQLDTLLLHIAVGARLCLCGLISRYEGAPVGLENWSRILYMRATMRGFIFLDDPALMKAAETDLLDRLLKGQIIFREEIIEGLQNAPRALEKLFDGSNTGRLLIKVCPDAA